MTAPIQNGYLTFNPMTVPDKVWHWWGNVRTQINPDNYISYKVESRIRLTGPVLVSAGLDFYTTSSSDSPNEAGSGNWYHSNSNEWQTIIFDTFEETYNVTFHLVSNLCQPLKGGTITLNTTTLISDAQGCAIFNNFPVGACQYSISCPGFLPIQRTANIDIDHQLFSIILSSSTSICTEIESVVDKIDVYYSLGNRIISLTPFKNHISLKINAPIGTYYLKINTNGTQYVKRVTLPLSPRRSRLHSGMTSLESKPLPSWTALFMMLIVLNYKENHCGKSYLANKVNLLNWINKKVIFEQQLKSGLNERFEG